MAHATFTTGMSTSTLNFSFNDSPPSAGGNTRYFTEYLTTTTGIIGDTSVGFSQVDGSASGYINFWIFGTLTKPTATVPFHSQSFAYNTPALSFDEGTTTGVYPQTPDMGKGVVSALTTEAAPSATVLWSYVDVNMSIDNIDVTGSANVTYAYSDTNHFYAEASVPVTFTGPNAMAMASDFAALTQGNGVPEPTSLAFLGFVALLARRRRIAL